MSVSISDLLGEIRELAVDMRQRAEDTGYGVFPGGDPNTFTPDPECSTEEERARWAVDCAKWQLGQRTGLTETRCDLTKPFGQMMRSGYGLGTYVVEDAQAADDAEKLEGIVSRLDAWLRERSESGAEADD